MKKKVLLTLMLLLLIGITCIFNVFAHKGKTDSSGGHRDTDNQSGLGSYHYHCGGYPAHLHSNGNCPYTSYASSSSSSTYKSSILESARKAVEERQESYNEGYDAGYNRGYWLGHYDGYEEGYNKRILLLTVVIMGTIFLIVVFVITSVRYLTRRIRRKRSWQKWQPRKRKE